MACSPIAVSLLIVKKHIRSIGGKEFSLVQTSQKNRFVDSYVPGPQRSYYPLVSRCGARRNKGGTNGRFTGWKCLLQ
jgi:hypothetical protein